MLLHILGQTPPKEEFAKEFTHWNRQLATKRQPKMAALETEPPGDTYSRMESPPYYHWPGGA